MTNKEKNATVADASSTPNSPARRKFLGQVGGATAATVTGAIGAPALLAPSSALAAVTPDSATVRTARAAQALAIRHAAALFQASKPSLPHPDNGDAKEYADRRGSFSKGLEHFDNGLVKPTAFNSLKRALESGKPSDFEKIKLGGTRKMVNPQAGLAFDMEGADAHLHVIRPAPAYDSAEQASEIVENYWMALLRDVPFDQYDNNAIAAAAVTDLNNMSDFRGPKINGQVTPQTLFRENFVGVLQGPFVSQMFLLGDKADNGYIPYGTNGISQHVRAFSDDKAKDYMKDSFAEYLAIQRGAEPAAAKTNIRRYMTNGRDLSEWVHVDVLWQAYFMACLVMDYLKVPLNETNPYNGSATQIGFGTFGAPWIKTLLVEAATRALKAVWYQKWYVHLRLRPEVFGAHVHQHMTGNLNLDIHSDALNSTAVSSAFSKNGTFLLPMAFTEGSPTHPAYGAGHATVAGACVSIIKALYKTDIKMVDLPDGNGRPQMVDPANFSLLANYNGADANEMTVEGELNKIGVNVANGRNIAGVHWRTDGRESMLLGEQVAIGILQDTKRTFNENREGFFAGFKFNGFLGNEIKI